jgi:hypothetical protein
LSAREAYRAGVAGALCDDETSAALDDIAATFPWSDST